MESGGWLAHSVVDGGVPPPLAQSARHRLVSCAVGLSKFQFEQGLQREVGLD